MQQRIDHVEASAGEDIAYAVVGEGPLLVLAAWWTSHLELDWLDHGLRSFIEALAERHTVVRYDRPGVGLSSRGERVYDLDTEAEYLRAVVDAVTAGDRSVPVDLIGISCGGPASIRLAVERPHQVRRLVLFGSYATGADISDEATRSAITALVRANWGMGSQTLTNILLPGADPAAARRFHRAQRDMATNDVAADLLDLTFRLDAAPYVGDVAVPTLVLHRSHDRVIECGLGRDLADRIPGAEFGELEGRAHVPWTDDCTRALDMIERFLTGANAPPVRRRRLATVCMVDVVDSTRLLSDIGDARWRERQDELHAMFAEEVGAREGDVVKDTGDGALIAFDLPSDALDFATTARRRAKAIDVVLRCGIHMGEVEVREDDLTGLAVVVASRTCDAAGADQILVTRTVADLVMGGPHALVEAGTRDLKGIAGEWAVWELDPVATSDEPAPRRTTATYRFGEFELDPAAFELRRSGAPVTIEPQVFEVLHYLVARAGELVTKEQLLDDVWGDRFVSESSLSSRIRSARVAVGDDGQRQAMIKTIHGRGFRFLAALDE